jgi:periplasmic glucans biosynthesis protein
MLSRRDSLAALAAAIAFFEGTAPAMFRFADVAGEPFSWDRLKALALLTARKPWRPLRTLPDANAIDFEEVNRISYRAAKALWPRDGFRETRFFPLHRFANIPVSISVVENGRARPFSFSPDLFELKADKRGTRPNLAAGLAGFRLMKPGGKGDWLAFQGASYFRSAGALDQYGLSARGLAINTGIDGQEEFPTFTSFWLERGPAEAITVYALLEGPSVAGAYRFVNRLGSGGPSQEVTVSLHLRRDVARLGFAPLTSMFWYGEGNRAAATDWRPEIHDSDGLAMFNGAGERIWRPLTNPARPTTYSFVDRAPRGFGLLQRDRDFAHYQDDGAFYDKRPNLWVEPTGDWGAGAVMLYEIPTRREIEDNIVAFWTPAAAAKAGNHYDLDYRLHWTATDPAPAGLARVVDCWTGTAGPPGLDPIAGARRLVADFEGERLAGLGRDSGVEAVVSPGGRQLIASYAYPVVGTNGRWRMIADIALSGSGANELRAYLKRGHDALSETLLYPFA